MRTYARRLPRARKMARSRRWYITSPHCILLTLSHSKPKHYQQQSSLHSLSTTNPQTRTSTTPSHQETNPAHSLPPNGLKHDRQRPQDPRRRLVLLRNAAKGKFAPAIAPQALSTSAHPSVDCARLTPPPLHSVPIPNKPHTASQRNPN